MAQGIFASPEQRYQNLNWQSPVDGKKLGYCESSKTRKIAVEIFATVGLSSLAVGAYLATQTVVALATLQVFGAVAAVSLLFALTFKLLPPSLNDPVNANKALADVRKMVDANRPYSEIVKKYPKIAEFAREEILQAIFSKKMTQYQNYNTFIQTEGLDIRTQFDAVNHGLLCCLANGPLPASLNVPESIQSFLYHQEKGLVEIQNQYANSLLLNLDDPAKNALYEAVMKREVIKLQDGSQTLNQFIERNGLDSLQFVTDKTAVSQAFKQLQATDMAGIGAALGARLFGNPFETALTAYRASLENLQAENTRTSENIKQKYAAAVAKLKDEKGLTALTGNLNMLTAKITETESQLNSKRLDLQKLLDKKKKCENGLAQLNEAALQNSIKNLERTIFDLIDNINKNERELSELKFNLLNIERLTSTTIQTKEREIRENLKLLNHLIRQIAEIEDPSVDHRLFALNKEISDLQGDQQQESGFLNSLVNATLNGMGLSKLEEARKEHNKLASLKASLTQLKQERDTVEANIQGLRTLIQDLNKPETVENNKAQLMEQIKSQTNRLAQLKQSLLQSQNAHEQNTNSLKLYTRLKETLQKIQPQIETMQTDLRTLEDKHKELDRSKLNIQTRMQSINAELIPTLHDYSGRLLQNQNLIKTVTEASISIAQNLLFNTVQNMVVNP